MAAGDAVQIGVEYLIGIGNMVYLTHTVKSVGISSSATETEHTDERGATDSVLLQNPAVTLDLTVDLVGTSTTFNPPLVGDVISVKGPDDATAVGYRVKSANTKPSDGVASRDISLIREDSMQVAYDALI